MNIFKSSFKAALSLLLLSAWSCESVQEEPMPGSAEIPMSVTLQTYASSPDTNAMDREKRIASAYVFIFNADGTMANPGNTRVLPSGGSVVDAATGKLNGTWTVYEGLKTVYVIANPGSVGAFTNPAVPDPSPASVNLATWVPNSVSDLETLITTSANYGAVYRYDRTYTEGLLMTGKQGAMVDASNSNLTIPLERRYARIDVSVRRGADLAGEVVKVKAGSVTAHQVSTQAQLFASVPAWMSSTLLGSTQVNNQNATVELTSETDYTSLYSFYVMPYAYSQGSTPLMIEIPSDISGYTNVYELSLAQIGSNGKPNTSRPIDIEGNTVYKLSATLSKHISELTVNMMVCPWEEQPSQEQTEVGAADFTITNCYLLEPTQKVEIPVASVYKAWARLAELGKTPIPDGEVTTELLWQDSPNVIFNGNLYVSDGDKRDKAHIVAKVSGVGNAVVAMKVNGKIYWSFHIWVLEHIPIEDADASMFYNQGDGLFRYNLGATSLNKEDGAKTFGLLYQWGRKDPFIGARAAGSTSYAPVYDISGQQLWSGSLPADGTILQAVQNPSSFLTSSTTGEWYAQTSPDPDFLWKFYPYSWPKSIYDPCPMGYCISADGLTSDYYYSSESMLLWDEDNSGYGTAPNWNSYAGTVWFPLTGYRDQNNQLNATEGSRWLYSRTYSPFSRTDQDLGRSIGGGAQGRSVRCVKIN